MWTDRLMSSKAVALDEPGARPDGRCPEATFEQQTQTYPSEMTDREDVGTLSRPRSPSSLQRPCATTALAFETPSRWRCQRCIRTRSYSVLSLVPRPLLQQQSRHSALRDRALCSHSQFSTMLLFSLLSSPLVLSLDADNGPSGPCSVQVQHGRRHVGRARDGLSPPDPPPWHRVSNDPPLYSFCSVCTHSRAHRWSNFGPSAYIHRTHRQTPLPRKEPLPTSMTMVES